MNTIWTPPSSEAVNAQNAIAAVLSMGAPGLGQVYKGHLGPGLLWMFVGMPVVLWVGLLLSLATAGIGLLFPLMCWAGLVVDAYYTKDRHRHHALPPVDLIRSVEQD